MMRWKMRRVRLLRVARKEVAMRAAMEMIGKFSSVEDATQGVHGMLERKDKIMGFGHAIYRTSDPRNVIIKQWAEKLANE